MVGWVLCFVWPGVWNRCVLERFFGWRGLLISSGLALAAACWGDLISLRLFVKLACLCICCGLRVAEWGFIGFWHLNLGDSGLHAFQNSVLLG